MKKIKIISNWDYKYVERAANEFIAVHGAKDIRYQAFGNDASGKTYSVMIVYGED